MLADKFHSKAFHCVRLTPFSAPTALQQAAALLAAKLDFDICVAVIERFHNLEVPPSFSDLLAKCKDFIGHEFKVSSLHGLTAWPQMCAEVRECRVRRWRI